MLNKILIIGTGIAGPSVCYWLKRFGFSPTLIEKSPTIRAGGQALDIRGVANDVVKKMGIFAEICENRTQINTAKYVDKAGNLLHEEFGENVGFRQEDEVEILRGDLITLLLKTIPDVPVNFNQYVTNLIQEDNAVSVHFNDDRVEQYDLVIGADGIYSSTRNLVFDKHDFQLYKLGAFISTFSIPNYLNLNHTELVCEANLKMVSINSDNDAAQAMAAFMFRADHTFKNIRDEVEQQAFLRETFHDFGWEVPKILNFMSATENFYFDAVTQVKMESWTRGRVALLGDSGYCPSPLSGQGNNLAIVGAYVLAGELNEARGDYVKAFDRYNKLMKPFITAAQDFGELVSQTFLVPDSSSKEITASRQEKMMELINVAANAIDLPEY